MNSKSALVVLAAIVVGLAAVFVANSYFSAREMSAVQSAAVKGTVKVVVASQELAFGTRLNPQNLRLVDWPANSVPAGAFTKFDDAMRDRVALRPIAVGEPVLASKVSGAGGRATLSANLPAGQVAYAIPISDVGGVAGFVRPGDVVDVLLTRQIPGEGAQAYDKMTDTVLEAVQVLAVDQIADEKKTEPAVGKTATLQVDANGAQKLALSTQLGVLSLALRNVADQQQGFRPTVTRRDISKTNLYIPARGGAAAFRPGPVRVASMGPALSVPAAPMGPTMTVVRGVKTSQEGVLRGF